MIPNIVQTEDGSITCIDTNSGELYHNRVGAYTEALSHYVQVCDLSNRLKTQSNISVLDVCFGLGYNSFVLIGAILQYIETANIRRSPISCHIIGIDQDKNILELIPQVLQDPRFNRLRDLLNINTQKAKEIVSQWQTNGTAQFHFKNKAELSISIEMKIEDIRKAVPQLVKAGKQFDYIFHDGFSPRAMPELWTTDLFVQYAQLISDSGRIITYSSAYAVRGGLIECDLEVRKTAPLGGKSGGTVAFKKGQSEIVNQQSIFFLSDEETKPLQSRSGTPYRDPDFHSSGKEITQHRHLEINSGT